MTISGPYYKSFQTPGASNAPGAYKYFRTWYRQTRPWVHPLAFSFNKTRIISGNQLSLDNMGPIDSNLEVRATNQAYERFKNGFYNSVESQMAVNIAERKQAVSMISKRSLQLLQFTRAVRRGQIHKAAAAIGLSKPPRKRERKWARSKDWSDLWLEFHFGWAPLVGDIGSAVEILQSGIPPAVVSGSGSASGTTISHPYSHWSESWTVTDTSRVNVKMKAKVQITSPNLHLANQMGFVNPFSVVWELVPFSFVVDWFTNVGDILASMSDFAGSTLIDPYTTKFSRHNQDVFFTSTFTPGIAYTGVAEQILVQRSLGLSAPSFEVKPFRGFSVTRGATAIALLLQSMK